MFGKVKKDIGDRKTPLSFDAVTMLPPIELYDVWMTFTDGSKYVHKKSTVRYLEDHVELTTYLSEPPYKIKERVYIPTKSLLFLKQVRVTENATT